ncbi:MAG: metalloprotease, partial [Flavobacteriaceae bacterium]|nr:metalloprotease [Flavobacteriaceae bacterium]
MKFSLIHLIALIGLCQLTFGQNKMEVRATFDTDKSQAKILQYIEYKNTSNTTLDTIYFNDWSNSFSTKKTPLAMRFAEEYDTGFFFAKNEERGFTTVFTVTDHQNKSLNFEHLKAHPDVLEVVLDQPLL